MDLHILLIPDKKHERVFQDIPTVEYRNGNNLKDHLVRVMLANVEKLKNRKV